MDIVAYDPYIHPSKVTDLDMTYTKNFEDILACDIITIRTPKNKETIGMINDAEFAKMKDTPNQEKKAFAQNLNKQKLEFTQALEKQKTILIGYLFFS